MEQIKTLIKKFCTKEVILYVIFGILTTLVNIVSFYILTNFINLEENLSNVIAIILCILFAYFTNRKLVFNSTASTSKEKFAEFSRFILGRVFTMVVEIIGFFLMFNIGHMHELVSKVLISILVIILNFFISKFFAFNK